MTSSGGTRPGVDLITDPDFHEKVRLAESLISLTDDPDAARSLLREGWTHEQVAIYDMVAASIRLEHERARAADR